MSWNYRVMKIEEGGETTYGVYEVYYDDEGSPRLYTKNPCPVFGNTIEELTEELGRFRRALDKPILTPRDVIGDVTKTMGDDE